MLYSKSKEKLSIFPSPSWSQDSEKRTNSPRDPVAATVTNDGARDTLLGQAGKKQVSDGQLLTLLLQMFGGLAAVCAGTARPLMTLIFGGLVNTYNNNNHREVNTHGLEHSIDRQVLLLLYIFIGQWALICLHGALFSIAAMRHTMKLRASYMRATICRPLEDVNESKAAIDLSTNIGAVEDALAERLGTVLQALSTVITSLVIAFTRSWRLTLTTMFSILLLICNNFGTAAIDARLEAGIQDINSRASILAEECISGIRTVTAYNARSKMVADYTEFLDAAKKKGLLKSPISAAQYSITYFIVLAAYGLGFWYGTKLLRNGEITSGGSIIIVILCINQAANALLLLLPTYGILANAKAISASLKKTTSQKPRTDPFSNQGLLLHAPYTRIEFQNVGFAYPNRPSVNVLAGLNLVVGAGKTTAIIGPSGCGKSTLIGLLERWYEPANGEIKINGHDLDQYNIRSLRSNIRVVQQDSVLFNDSVFENVAHGLIGSPFHDISVADKRSLVVKVCRDIGAHDFIEQLAHGYDTIVGHRGSLLSGGQRQRIAIARAIISNPAILIFDEATSALDSESEREVQLAINRVTRGRTTMIIAHNLATIKRADRIVLLKDGEVNEEGTHNSLLRTSDTYVQAWLAQRLASDDALKQQGLDTVDTRSSSSRSSDLAKSEENPTQAIDSAPRAHQRFTDLGEEFDESFYGCVKSITSTSRTLLYLLSGSALLCLIAGSVYPAQAVLFAQAATAYQKTGHQTGRSIDFWSLMFFTVALGALGAFGALAAFSSSAATITSRTFRETYFRAMFHQAMPFFDHNTHTPGYLVASLASHPAHVQGFVSTLSRLGTTAVNLGSVSILGLMVSWRFGLVALFGSFPVIILAGYLRVKSQSRKSKMLSGPLMDSAQYASEALSNIRVVSAFAMEEEVCTRMEQKMKSASPEFYKNILISMPLFAFSHSGYLLGMTLSFWYSGHLLVDHRITALHLWIVFVGIVAGAEAAGEFFASANSVVDARSSCGRISQLVRSAQKPSDNVSGEAEKTTLGTIELDRVTFSYPTAPDRVILKDVTFRVPQGSKVAIVGPSGSGKSSIISLLERFYDTTGGEIRVSGNPLSTVGVDRYRSAVSLVAQDTQLFEGTVRDNILLGVPKEVVDEETLVRATQDAYIHDFIVSLPEGYNTMCGKKGLSFSGGQRQRIAIARALVRNPSILLLDEATSALDSESELEVKKALRNASEGRTTVAVAHRLSTIQDADRILVLVKGSIVEEGTHAELSALRGVYWSMCRKQT